MAGGRSDERVGVNDVATVTVTVPGLLARFTDGRRTVTLQAGTLGGSLDRLVDSYPPIEAHLFDGQGRLRSHLKLCHNWAGVEWPNATSVELHDGDDVTVLQAVSGG